MKRRKERSYRKQKKELLGISKVKNPKEFWNKLKLKHKGIPFNFSQNELYEHFKALSGDKIKDPSDSGDSIIEYDTDAESETTNLFEKEILDILGRVISIDEVRKVIRNMKNGKAAGLDKTIPELLKYVDDNFLDLMTLILNKIFDSGKFPEEWALGVIVILFKEGTKSDLNNYRGITLLSMLGKILEGILSSRLWEVVNRFEILAESEAGFRQGYRTIDHLFALTTVIDHYTTKNKKPLSLCFINFRKAFDKIDHELLWRKISKYGAGGKFLDII